MNPMISVIMSSFNGSKTIDEAIKSILNQTYSDFEFIICDDYSTDDTWFHLKHWANNDSRIIIFRNKHNCGLQISLNKCLAMNKGKYVARMDDDDISLPYRLKKEICFLKCHPKIAFVGSYICQFDDKGIYCKTTFSRNPTIKQIFKKNQFCHPDVMIRSNILKYVNGYSNDKRYRRIEDLELWLRLYSLGYSGANIPSVLFEWRMNLYSHRSRFYDYINRFRLLYTYKKKLKIGFLGYFYVFLPLFKLLVPPIIRNMYYNWEYKR